MEINSLAVIVGLAIMVIGPGSGVWVAMRAAIDVLRKDNERQAVLQERQAGLLEEINGHLEMLNSRVSKSEDHIEGLERREAENGG